MRRPVSTRRSRCARGLEAPCGKFFGSPPGATYDARTHAFRGVPASTGRDVRHPERHSSVRFDIFAWHSNVYRPVSGCFARRPAGRAGAWESRPRGKMRRRRRRRRPRRRRRRNLAGRARVEVLDQRVDLLFDNRIKNILVMTMEAISLYLPQPLLAEAEPGHLLRVCRRRTPPHAAGGESAAAAPAPKEETSAAGQPERRGRRAGGAQCRSTSQVPSTVACTAPRRSAEGVLARRAVFSGRRR